MSNSSCHPGGDDLQDFRAFSVCWELQSLLPPPLGQETGICRGESNAQGQDMTFCSSAFADVTVGNKIYSPYSELEKEASPKQTQAKGIFCGFYLLWVIEVTSLCSPGGVGGLERLQGQSSGPSGCFTSTTNKCIPVPPRLPCFPVPGRHSRQAEGSWWWLLNETEGPKHPSLPRE